MILLQKEDTNIYLDLSRHEVEKGIETHSLTHQLPIINNGVFTHPLNSIPVTKTTLTLTLTRGRPQLITRQRGWLLFYLLWLLTLKLKFGRIIKMVVIVDGLLSHTIYTQQCNIRVVYLLPPIERMSSGVTLTRDIDIVSWGIFQFPCVRGCDEVPNLICIGRTRGNELYCLLRRRKRDQFQLSGGNRNLRARLQ